MFQSKILKAHSSIFNVANIAMKSVVKKNKVAKTNMK